MLIIAGHLRVAAAERERYLPAVEAVTVRAREAPGCLEVLQAADVLDRERINILERWASGDGSRVTPPVLAAEVARYRIASVEEP